MPEAKTCPKCGAELPPHAPAGICPKCLMGAGLDSQTEAHQSDGGSAFAATTPQTGGFIPPEPESLAPHFPQLEIVELLGHGGMGAVYKARQTKLDRFVALKIIRPESADDPAFAERFRREARTLARLNHPNIVAVHDFGEVTVGRQADGDSRTLYYFVMEFVDGTNLRQLIQAGELQPEEALAIIPQICDALHFAHEDGVVHRDIKPENVLLDSKGRVKIADFGLAKLASRSERDFTLTGTHQVMGTPRYMAPEQMEGSHAVDHRADIYSLGVVFYEMLTGDVPAGHFQPPSKKVEIDVRLDEVVLRSLAKEPERRYQQASEVKTDVESIRHGGESCLVGEPRTSATTGSTLAVNGEPRRPHLLLRFLLSTTLWGCLLCGAGIYTTFQPWGEVYNLMGISVPAAGFGWPHGMVACFSLVVLLLFLPATATVRPVPVWRPIVVILIGMVVLARCGSFVTEFRNGTLAVQPLLDAAKWGMSIDGRSPLTIDEANVATKVCSGPYLLMGIVVGLMMLAAIDFRAALHSAPRRLPRERPVDLSTPRFSRKAIAGACWAPSFFLLLLILVPSLLILVPNDAEHGSMHPTLLLVVLIAFLGLTGLPAPFGTTILGLLALSDIRHSQGRITGTGLAYLDAVLFPLLALDAVVFGAIFAAVSVFGQPQEGPPAVVASLFALPICLVVDVMLAMWGWRRVCRANEASLGGN